MKKSGSTCSEVSSATEDRTIVVLDGGIARVGTIAKHLSTSDRLIFHVESKPEELCEIVEKHTRVVFLAEFSLPTSLGWQFAGLAERQHSLFPVSVVGFTDRARDLDGLFNVVDSLPTTADMKGLDFALDNAALTAGLRHRRWQRARQSIRIVRQANDESRRAQGKQLISDHAWDRACMILCRAALEHGDDWELTALDLLVDLFKDEV